jgi:methyl-accepting chemotaxis protein
VAGTGFAVVATQEKHLAIRTAKATENIGARIETMHRTAGAVAAPPMIGAIIDRMDGIAIKFADAADQLGHATQLIAAAVQSDLTRSWGTSGRPRNGGPPGRLAARCKGHERGRPP